MALQDGLLAPIGLLALLSVIPVIVLYLIQPDPRRVKLPTLRLLVEENREDASNPLFERIKRSLLLLIQLLVLIGLAVSLAQPYVTVSESRTVEETVLVVDGSASMATLTQEGTRFERAIEAARLTTSSTNSVVLIGRETRVVLRSGGAADVASTLDTLAVSTAPGDLETGISQAASIAGENARIVVFSDFAGSTGWVTAVQSARARGLQVSLRQITEGGTSNVGIIDRSFSGRNVTLSIKNFGPTSLTREVTLGDQVRTIDIDPGAVERVTLLVPAGGGEARLTPGDSFPVDNVAYLAAPSDPIVDVLLLTNDPDPYLTTALGVVDEVQLTVDQPPTTVSDDYDVIIYGATNPDRLLRGSVDAGRDTIDRGGGVAIVAQEEPPETYGDLLLIEPTELGTNPSIGRVTSHELTRGIDYPPPETYLQGTLRAGTSMVQTAEGTPLIAADTRGTGRVLYYGYLPDRDTFRFHFQYPVFWKRAVFYLAGRESLPALNRATGGTLQFSEPTRVTTPGQTVEARTVPLEQVGYYAVGNRRIGASLFSEAESDVTATPLAERPDQAGSLARQEESQVPQPLTSPVALMALALALGEVAYLRYRGDL